MSYNDKKDSKSKIAKYILAFLLLTILLSTAVYTYNNKVNQKYQKSKLSLYIPASIEKPILNDILIGDPSSPVRITMLSYVTCHACDEWFKNEYPKVKKDLIDTHKAYIILREVPYTSSDIMATTYLTCLPKKDIIPDLLVLQNDNSKWALKDNLNSFLPQDNINILNNIQNTLNTKFKNLKNYNDFNDCLSNTSNILSYLDNDKKTVIQNQIQSFPVFFVENESFGEYINSKQLENIVFQVNNYTKRLKLDTK
jgi:protein-disulfide isomerase